MKKILQLSFLLLTFFLAFQADSYGQRVPSKKSDADKYFDERGNFASRLWYGGGFVFPNFASGIDPFTGNRFQFFSFGISPMAGYKIFEDLSVGPRISLSYEFYKQGNIPSVNAFSYGAGVFARYKAFRTFFLHLEYGVDDRVINYQFNQFKNEFEPVRKIVNNGFVGVGYNDSSSIWGYEISFLYNILYDDSQFVNPFDIRFGLTYNF